MGQGSLKLIANGTSRRLWYGFLFAFHSNGRIFSRFYTMHEHDSQSTRRCTTAKAALMHSIAIKLFYCHRRSDSVARWVLLCSVVSVCGCVGGCGCVGSFWL